MTTDLESLIPSNQNKQIDNPKIEEAENPKPEEPKKQLVEN